MPNLLSKMYKKISLDQFMIAKHHLIAQFVTLILVSNVLLENKLNKIMRTSPNIRDACGHNYSLKCTLKNHIGSVYENKAQKCSIWCQTYSLK